MSTKINVNLIKGTIEISKAFYKKASTYGTPEYQELRNIMLENPAFKIVFKNSDKKTYNGLNLEKMEAYIVTQPNSEEKLIEFKAVMKVAEAKGSKYPLTKKWFFETFPEYKDNGVSNKETEALINEANENAKNNKESEKETETSLNNSKENTNIIEAISA